MSEADGPVAKFPRFLGSIPLAAVLIVLAGLAAYANSFSGPFVLDDLWAIRDNPAIHRWWTAIQPPHAHATIVGQGYGPRPVANLTFALNYAAGGIHVGGYHFVNLAIHLLAGLVFFGIVRRTLLLAPLRERFGAASTPLACLAALVWVVHPLQTEAVTYILQRAESLMGLFYLLTLYGFIRSLAAEDDGKWLVLSAIACLLGMGSKEVMASAPVLVWVYDRTFVSGSFRAALRRRPRYYGGLALTWLLLAFLMIDSLRQGGENGFGHGISWHAYALTQCEAVVHYLRLALWPRPLVFDYGTAVVAHPLAVLPQALFLLALVAATGWALARKSPLGFLGCWFFAILAPSSSFFPIVGQTMAEHRMYLPLAAIVVLAVTAGYAWIGARLGWFFLAVAVVFAGMTGARNADYRSALTLWNDTAVKRPDNPRALSARDDALLQAGETEASVTQAAETLRRNPASAIAHVALANALLRAERIDEAMAQAQEAIRLSPDLGPAHTGLGHALLDKDRAAEAVEEFKLALRTDPHDVTALNDLGNALVRLGEVAESVAIYQQALDTDPANPITHGNLGAAFLRLGRNAEAVEQFQAALRLDPKSAPAHHNMGLALGRMGRAPEAMAEFQAALRLDPDSVDAHRNLGVALVKLGRNTEALREFEAALQLDPADEHTRKIVEMLRDHAAPAAP